MLKRFTLKRHNTGVGWALHDQACTRSRHREDASSGRSGRPIARKIPASPPGVNDSV
jgi:hypothetical protein